ncbi:MAG TPA: DNA polymerase IV [Candidatus Paceibacterota bacterium]|nr:DNA polymerase IV [Candidatus Paceibacterota bacterium]
MERQIVHFDGDSFFASVEVALNHTLRGKPVVTGAERGAATSASYEAKRMGVSRSMTMKQIKEICPNVVVVNSDYRAYAIFAHRMYALVRRFTPMVEEYSVDECFADITGLDVVYKKSYPEIAQIIKEKLEESLGITFGVGLAPTKVLAKAASKFNKPAGFTHITLETRRDYLARVAVGAVWGIGTATATQLQALGIATALDFADKSFAWMQSQHMHKTHRALWYELNGTLVHELSLEHRTDIQSIIKSRTFSPPSTNKTFVYSQLAKNVERACERARAHGVRARAITFYLKTQSFMYGRIELDLPIATNDPRDILHAVKPQFEKLYRPGVPYRATGISLRSLVPQDTFTVDFFGEGEKMLQGAVVLKSIDAINHRYGNQSVFLGSSMQAVNYRERSRASKAAKRVEKVLMQSEYKKKSLDIPFLGSVQ